MTSGAWLMGFTVVSLLDVVGLLACASDTVMDRPRLAVALFSFAMTAILVGMIGALVSPPRFAHARPAPASVALVAMYRAALAARPGAR